MGGYARLGMGQFAQCLGTDATTACLRCPNRMACGVPARVRLHGSHKVREVERFGHGWAFRRRSIGCRTQSIISKQGQSQWLGWLGLGRCRRWRGSACSCKRPACIRWRCMSWRAAVGVASAVACNQRVRGASNSVVWAGLIMVALALSAWGFTGVRAVVHDRDRLDPVWEGPRRGRASAGGGFAGAQRAVDAAGVGARVDA